MSTDLRQKLIDAQLATYPEGTDEHSPAAGPHWRTNGQAADVALTVFAEWLREQAEWARPLGGIWDSVVAEWATELADSITTPKGEHG